MRDSIIRSKFAGRRLPQIAFSILTFIVLTSPAAFAQSGRDRVEGVKNFGRVTDRYFRGGSITSTGIESLAAMGVRTIIDLRDNPNADEPTVSRRHGIRYFNFPMTGHNTPDDKTVSEILSIIQNAGEPVYVHCSAGKHRAGTIAALYRMRVQGWSKDRAWAEQQSYGFGAPEDHAELYAYVYGSRADRSDSKVRSASDDKDGSKSSSKKKKKKEHEPGKAATGDALHGI